MKELLERYARFCAAVAKVRGLEVTLTPREVATPGSIEALEKLLGVRVPTDVRDFWQNDFSNVRIVEGDAVLAGDVLLGAAGALHAAKGAHALAKSEKAEEPLRSWLLQGIPLHDEQDYCFVEPTGAVRQMVVDGAAFTDPVFDSFREMFRAWLDAGCWSYADHDPERFRAYWDKVGKLLPDAMSVDENPWLQYCADRYDTGEHDRIVVVFQLGAAAPRALAGLADCVCYATAEPHSAAEPLAAVAERTLDDAQTDAMLTAIESYLSKHELEEHIDPEALGHSVGFHPDIDMERAIALLTDDGFTVLHYTPD